MNTLLVLLDFIEENNIHLYLFSFIWLSVYVILKLEGNDIKVLLDVALILFPINPKRRRK